MTIETLPAVSRPIPDTPGREGQTTPSFLDPWPPDPRERKDFYHRVRAFPPEVARWRDELIGRLLEDRPSLSDLPARASRERIRALLDDGLSWLREIARILAILYGTQPSAKCPPCITTHGIDPEAGRALTRLGPYRELGLNLDRLAPRRRLAVLAELVPPNIRPSLLANLAVHGRSICRRSQPACEQCDIRNFCVTWHRQEVARVERLSTPTVADLFCGAGGLSEGFSRAGFRPVLALDQDPGAVRTYWLNHPGVPESRLVQCDVQELEPGELRRLARGPVDVLIGAPPCQGFSHVGFRSKPRPTGYRITSDERNFLFEYMVSAAAELRPKLLVMENVPGMQSARRGQSAGRESLSFLEAAARMLEKRCGFRTTVWRLNASAYGVPQDRIRCFLVAARGRNLPERPPAEYQDMYGNNFDPDALPPVTFGEAVFDLPPREADAGAVVERWAPPDPASDVRHRRYLTKFRLLRRSALLYNHWARYQNQRDLELYALLRPGEDSIHALERYGRHDLMRYRRDVFDDKYARLRADRPSRTIVAHLAKDGNGYIYPTQVRSITPREAARLQSFHDGYVFCGSPTDQWVQIGNAVPPVLAEAIARSCLQVLSRGGRP